MLFYFFGGLQVAEIAELLGISPTNVERTLRSAKAWLAAALGSSDKPRGWIANAPILTSDITPPVQQIRKRYADLVDKKFTSALSPDERAELRQLAHTLDEAEAPFYELLEQALRIERDRLLKGERAKVKADK
jgi:hypothetical protein